MKTFDCMSANQGPRWTRWVTSFNFYADGKGLIIEDLVPGAAATHIRTQRLTRQRRRALMLHLAGQEVQDMFATLPDTGEPDNYTSCVTALNTYFVPQVNATIARQLFHGAKMEERESTKQFATKLRKLADNCNFGDARDDHIRDAIIWKCRSEYVKRKLLEESGNLIETLATAEQCERIEQQLAATPVSADNTVNRITKNPRKKNEHDRSFPKKGNKPNKSESGKGVCYRCGNKDHYGRDPKCPARGKQCSSCGKDDHFSKMCRSKQVHTVTDNDATHDEYAFAVRHGKSSCIPINIGGIDVQVLIDSWASANIVDENTWKELKQNGIKCMSNKATTKSFLRMAQLNR